jgi:hypothetical protein
MVRKLKSTFMVLAVTWVALGAATSSASAITAELARKCSALMAKQFPPREPGNPAAGSAKGSGPAQNDYFNKCVANNGNMDADKPAK